MSSASDISTSPSSSAADSDAADSTFDPSHARQVITWFEIPARDYERAIGFYERVLGIGLKREDDAEMGAFAMFPAVENATAGCVAPAQHCKPGADGTVIYLWCGALLDPVLARALAAGARVVAPKRILPHGIGAVAQIIDSEGNRVGLHAQA
jgi:predicted enzyme related to lactoylglutathione lyase